MGGRKPCGPGGPFSTEIRGAGSGDASLVPGLKVGCFHPRHGVRTNLVVGHRPCGCSAVERFLRPHGGGPTHGRVGGCARVSRAAVSGVLLPRRGSFVSSITRLLVQPRPGGIAVLGTWSCLIGLPYGTLFLWTDLLPAWRARRLPTTAGVAGR